MTTAPVLFVMEERHCLNTVHDCIVVTVCLQRYICQFIFLYSYCLQRQEYICSLPDQGHHRVCWMQDKGLYIWNILYFSQTEAGSTLKLYLARQCSTHCRKNPIFYSVMTLFTVSQSDLMTETMNADFCTFLVWESFKMHVRSYLY